MIEFVNEWNKIFKMNKLFKYKIIEIDIFEYDIYLISYFIEFDIEIINEYNLLILNIYINFWINN